MSWDDHIITIVGPMADVERFAKDHELLSGVSTRRLAKSLTAGSEPPMQTLV